MLQISKEEYEKCKIEGIDKKKHFWINRKDLEIESDVDYWAQILINVIQRNKNTNKSEHLMQNINNVGYLYEMI